MAHQYQAFKDFYEKNKGTESVNLKSYSLFLDPPSRSKLRYVRIYFDTPTFDRITKDRADKPVNVLSVIGGTMGSLSSVGWRLSIFSSRLFSVGLKV